MIQTTQVLVLNETRLQQTNENSVPCGFILRRFYCTLACLWGSIMIQINTNNISESLFLPHKANCVPGTETKGLTCLWQ
jgi:hypothetical protein